VFLPGGSEAQGGAPEGPIAKERWPLTDVQDKIDSQAQIDEMLQRFADGFSSLGARPSCTRPPSTSSSRTSASPALDGVPLEAWYIPAVTDVPRILGRPASSFDQFAMDYAEAFS
jgi:hypothetical protein